MPRSGFVLLSLITACESSDPCTTEGAQRCDGEVLQECVDGTYVDDEDCGANGMICHIEMGHCMEPTD